MGILSWPVLATRNDVQFEPDRPSLSDRGRASVAFLLSFERLEYRFFCDIRDR